MRAYKRNFFEEVVLVDDERKVKNPAGVSYITLAAYPAVGVSYEGFVREFILMADAEFWEDADETEDMREIACAIGSCGGVEKLNGIFERLEKKIRRG